MGKTCKKNIVKTKRYESSYGTLLLGSIEGKLCLCDWLVEKHHHVERRLKRDLKAEFEEGTSEIIEKTGKELD